MRRVLLALCNGLAWLCLVTSLPGIWLAGFFRGLAVGLLPVEPSLEDAFRRTRRYHGAVLTETDVATLIGTHESAIRRGEAKWQ